MWLPARGCADSAGNPTSCPQLGLVRGDPVVEPDPAHGGVAADVEAPGRPPQPTPSTAEIRTWALARGLDVADRGRLRPEIRQAWYDEHSRSTR